MTILHYPPAPSGRLAQFVRMLDAFERDEIELAVDMLIERLDARDGDSDLEADGDELDGSAGEDEFMRHEHDGPGCPIGDSDRCAAGEDMVRSGGVIGYEWDRGDTGPGDAEDAEQDEGGRLPIFGIDQSQPALNAWGLQ